MRCSHVVDAEHEFAGYNLASPSPLRRQRAGRPLPQEVAHPTRFERAACGVIRD